jgi:hypothetical protein
MATLEAVENRRANRKAAKAILRKPVAVVPSVAPPDPELTPAELTRIYEKLLPLVPTTAWADDIVEYLQRRKPNGKRIIPYTITDSGKLRTKITTLIAMIRAGDIFPPKADDAESCTIKTHSHHIGSTMKECWCRECAGVKLWPANYIVDGWISYTCRQNRIQPADDVPADRVTIADVMERIIYNPNAWRSDSISLLWPVEDEPADVVKALKKFKWRQVVGNVTARVVDHGLHTVGALDNFVQLGHSVASVVGDAAWDVLERLERYPREPRAVGCRVIGRRTGTRRR